MSSSDSGHDHPNYVKVWAILVVLLILSILGPMIGIQAVTLITAFGIAVVKAYLVVKNFMHINIEPKFIGYLMATALAFMFLFYAGVAPDVRNHHGRNWSNQAAKTEVHRALEAAKGHGAAAHGAEGGGEHH